MSHLENNNILTNNQYGFREGRSTTAAVLSLTDFVLESFDNKKHAVGVFLDLTKAFETVKHDILLDKLALMGVNGRAYQWFLSYLSDRKQYINYLNQNSSLLTLSMSIPQGSIMGPFLFNV